MNDPIKPSIFNQLLNSRDQVTLKFYFFCHLLHPISNCAYISFQQFRMTFTEDYADILLPFIEEYKKAKNEKQRKAVLQNAGNAVSESSNLREGDAMALPSNLQKVFSHLHS